MHPMVMACAVSVNPRRKAGGASQGLLNALNQESGSSQHEKSGGRLFSKNDLRAIVIPSSTYLLELDPMRSKKAAQLKHLIKTEQEIYTSLLCQHASEEGAHLSCSPTFRSLSYHYSPAFTWADHILLSLSSYAGNSTELHVPSIDAAYIKVPLSGGPGTAWE